MKQEWFRHMKLLILLIGFVMPVICFGQQQINLIQLKSGGAIKGEILSQNRETVEIKLLSGEVIKLSATSISSISSDHNKYQFHSNGKFSKTQGPYFTYLSNILIGNKENQFDNSLETEIGFGPISFSSGWQFNSRIEAGLGVGLDLYDLKFIPIFAEVRYYLLGQKIFTPFIGGKIGYSCLLDFSDFTTTSSGGLMLNPIIGFKIASRSKTQFLLETGLRVQKFTLEQWNYVDDYTYLRYSFGLGIRF